jgi:hypothetical protein
VSELLLLAAVATFIDIVDIVITDAIPTISIVFMQVLQNDDGKFGRRSRAAHKAQPTGIRRS